MSWAGRLMARYIVVRAVKPTVLIGTSTHSRSFNEEIIREMVGMPDGIVRNKADSRQAKHVERPIIVSTSRWGKAEVLMIT
jgi:malic enzyme